MKKSFLLSVLLAFYLLACRDTDDILPNHPPVANAGNDTLVSVSSRAHLNGSVSSDENDDLLEYIWSFVSIPAGSTASIEDRDSMHASVIPDVEGEYIVRLRITDNIAVDFDTVVVTAEIANLPPNAVITNVPAGVDLGQTVELQGNTSSDPEGEALTFSWTVVNKPAGSTIVPSAPTQSSSSFTFDRPGTYIIQLEVSDGPRSDATQVTITTNAPVITSINPTSGPHSISVKILGNN